MKKHRKNTTLVIIIFILFYISGCAFHHVPVPEAVDLKNMQEIDAPLRMQIINVQDNSDETNFGNYGWGKMVGDLKSWTNSAVDCAKQALGKKGVVFLDNSSKILKFAVTDVRVQTVGVPLVASLARCIISLKVETGDGYTKTYEGANKSINPPFASNIAMATVVSHVFEDNKIKEYLSN